MSHFQSDPSQPPFDPNRYPSPSPEPWEPGGQVQSPSTVWRCFIAFVIAMVLMGVLCLASGYVCQFHPSLMLEAQKQEGATQFAKTEADVQRLAKVYFTLGAAYVLIPLGIFAIPRSPTRWVYGLLVLGLGLLSCMFPFSIVMGVFWVLPTTRAYFWEEPQRP